MKNTTALLMIAGAALFGGAPQVHAQTTQCNGNVQGKIAWDYSGTTAWADTNVQKLCQGTRMPAEPGRCFDRAMHGGINWGGGTQWQWENAINLCQGTNSADASIGCFQSKIAAGVPWSGAIEQCKAPENACAANVQGKIAWDYSGDKAWAPANVQNLCKGATVASEPGRCFDRAMHGGISWGSGTQWQWENALSLCQGTINATATISCFQSKIALGSSWADAIRACK